MEQTDLGSRLKARRLELGLSVQDVAEKTRISRTYLEALEADRFEVLPGGVYLSGFLRVYAEELGLDSGPVLELIRQRDRSETGPGEIAACSPSFLSEGPKTVLKKIVLLAVAISLAGGIGVFALRWLFPGHSPAEAVEQLRPGETFVRHSPKAPATPPSRKPFAKKTASAPSGPLPAEAGATARLSAPTPGMVPSSGKSRPTSALSPQVATPPIPPGGAVLRLEALGVASLDVSIDGRPPQGYLLKKGVSLSWNVSRSVHVSVDQPANVKLWLGDRPLGFDAGKEISLGMDKTATDEGKT
jgi:cytoskeleton protein RodZ